MKEKIVGSTYKNIDLSKLTFTQKTKPKTIVDHDGSNVTIEVPTGIPECVVEGWIYPENTNQYDKDAKLIEVFTLFTLDLKTKSIDIAMLRKL